MLGEEDHDEFWHCIKSFDVHRFSMGFALDEASAQMLVRDASRAMNNRTEPPAPAGGGSGSGQGDSSSRSSHSEKSSDEL